MLIISQYNWEKKEFKKKEKHFVSEVLAREIKQEEIKGIQIRRKILHVEYSKDSTHKNC